MDLAPGQITDDHLSFLRAHAVTDRVAAEVGVYSATDLDDVPEGFRSYGDEILPALVFPWREPNGRVVQQLKPHVPVMIDGRAAKYLFVSGESALLGAVRVADGAGAVLIVEGTKQSLAAAGWAPEGFDVYGIAGCRQWSRDGVPTPDLNVVEGKDVYVCLDGDVATNLEVYDAGVSLGAACLAEGATGVLFVQLPAGRKAGLDDVLGSKEEDRRSAYLARLIETAAKKPAPVKPRAKSKGSDEEASPYFGDGGLMVAKLARDIYEMHPSAITAENKLALYMAGVYRTDPAAFSGAVGELLGDLFRPAHRAAAEEFSIGKLYRAEKIIPAHVDQPLLNVTNGMLDLRTLELLPHSPDYLSTTQLTVPWEPDATAPAYERWLASQIPDQVDDLEEVASMMLDPSRTPTKALFAFGPPRSGKSTFLRLLQRMAGARNFSAITLHQLSDDRFAAANVFGMILNCAADLSAKHVADMSIFRMMTGEDPIPANRKYGGQFSFTNRALFAFSANKLPTVEEGNEAYLERIKPFWFGNSFAGRENPELEREILTELPGILVRWIAAYQRQRARGGYLATATRVQSTFETNSDRVRQWVADECTVEAEANGVGIFTGSYLPTRHATGRRELARAFNKWSERNGTPVMGERKIIERLTSIKGVYEVRLTTDKSRALNVILKEDGSWKGAEEAESNPTVPDAGFCVSSETGITDMDMTCSPICTTVGVETASSASSVSFDLEGASADELWSRPRGEYLRLAGHAVDDGPVEIDTDMAPLIRALESGGEIVGHNILSFDLIALARHHGLDIHSLTGRIVDTKLTSFLLDPPSARMKSGQIEKAYSLQTLCSRLFGETKTGDLKALAKEFGGFDMIPTDDERYRTYLTGDVTLTRQLRAVLPLTPYIEREHRLGLLAATMSLNGFRVDLELLDQRVQAGRATRERLLERLVTQYALPSTRKDGKPSTAPQNTAAGREAIKQAFSDAGAPHMPTTDGGAWATGQEAMEKMKAHYAHIPAVIELADVIQSLNGIRTVFETVDNYRVADRVHPSIDMRQASGRWSITKPGLTVMGKRGGRHVEREIFLPEPGESILCVDMDQVDMRAIAGLCQDKAYMALFAPGQDVHAQVSLAVFGTVDRREDAKAIGHGWNYGRSVRAISEGGGIPLALAEKFDESMRDRFPDLIEWREDVRALGADGQDLDNGFGRKMRVDPERAWTQAPALMGQGAARDLMMEGLLRLPPQIRPMLRALVHDEIVLSVPTDDFPDVARVVKEALTFEWNGVPITSGTSKPGRNWGNAYEK